MLGLESPRSQVQAKVRLDKKRKVLIGLMFILNCFTVTPFGNLLIGIINTCPKVMEKLEQVHLSTHHHTILAFFSADDEIDLYSFLELPNRTEKLGRALLQFWFESF